MKKIVTLIGLLVVSVFGVADDHAPSVGGIETYSCTFNEGNDLDDVLAVAKKWNKFANLFHFFATASTSSRSLPSLKVQE